MSIAIVAPIVAILIVSATLLSAGTAAEPASAGTADDELAFVRLINDLRESKDLRPLTVDTELTAQARIWSRSMADADDLAHAPDMTTGITAPWTVLGENVGVNGTTDIPGLFDAFVASPTHYQNLVDPRFQYVGIGVVHGSDGKLWTTHRFMATADSTPTTSPPTAPVTEPPTTQPPTTQPPSTAPPTTATPPTTAPAATTPTSAQATNPSTAAPVNGPGASTNGSTTTEASASDTVATDEADTTGTTGRVDDGADGRSTGDLRAAVVDTADLVDEIELDVELIEQVLNDVAAVPF